MSPANVSQKPERKQARKRPTSKDVARLAGVSRTTVSYVLNNRRGDNIRIPQETRDRVWAAARELGYQPISAARTLRLRRSNMIVLMVPDIINLYYPYLAMAAQHEAEQADRDVFIYNTLNDPRRERDFVDVLIRRGVDGLIAQTFQLDEQDIGRLVDAGVAVVIHGNEPTHPYADNVLVDELQAVHALVSGLIARGHRRIGTLAGPQTMWTGRLRQEGYVNALRTHHIPLEEQLIYPTDYSRESGYQGMKHLLALPDPPTAVFAADDLLAIGGLLAATDLGLSVPRDVAVAGFDDIPEATIVRPRLTTIRKNVELLGQTAVDLLLERLGSEELLPSRQRAIDYEIVYRESA
jgi:DNA-binding LacI/PurR family transcriptional regulator